MVERAFRSEDCCARLQLSYPRTVVNNAPLAYRECELPTHAKRGGEPMNRSEDVYACSGFFYLNSQLLTFAPSTNLGPSQRCRRSPTEHR